MTSQIKELKEKISKLLDLESGNAFRMSLVLGRALFELKLMIKKMNKLNWMT